MFVNPFWCNHILIVKEDQCFITGYTDKKILTRPKRNTLEQIHQIGTL